VAKVEVSGVGLKKMGKRRSGRMMRGRGKRMMFGEIGCVGAPRAQARGHLRWYLLTGIGGGEASPMHKVCSRSEKRGEKKLHGPRFPCGENPMLRPEKKKRLPRPWVAGRV